MNNQPSTKPYRLPQEIWQIIVPYAVLATLWILFSDQLVGRLFHDTTSQLLANSVKGLLFVLPYAAFDALRSVLPPLAAADDPEALKVLRRVSVPKGGVPMPLFR